jgi:hypothetical protein
VAIGFARAAPAAISWLSPGASMQARGGYAAMAAHALNGLVGSKDHERGEEADEQRLGHDGAVVDECDPSDGLLPMLHANILMMAYSASGCMAAVHAAVITHGDRCILMPAVAGSGKTTLTAALLASGFGYGTDDLALLSDAPVRIRAIPVCLGLKAGAWPVLAEKFPGLRKLPVYRRADGQAIRYLQPPPETLPEPGRDFSPADCIVFPCYQPDTRADIRRISSAGGLLRLTDAGYDFPTRMDQGTVQCLINWISGIPCYELQYGGLDEAVRLVGNLVS